MLRLQGGSRIGGMRTTGLPAAAAVVFLLTGCAAGDGAIAEPTATPEALSTTTPTPSAPSPRVDDACLDSALDSPAPDGVGEQIKGAGESTELPAAVVGLGTQVITSADDPGAYEAVVRVCGADISRGDLISIGNDIARSIYATPAHEQLSVLVVSSWAPTGDTVEQVDSIRTSVYQAVIWDSGSTSADHAWE